MASLIADRSEDAAIVVAFANSFISPRCAACRCGANISQPDVERFFAASGDAFHLTCLACAEATCLGCGIDITAATDMQSSITLDGRSLRWHCDKARSILLWAVLCGYDHKTKCVSPSERQQPPAQSSSKRVKSGTRSSGVGYSLDEDDYDQYHLSQNDVSDVEVTVDGELVPATLIVKDDFKLTPDTDLNALKLSGEIHLEFGDGDHPGSKTEQEKDENEMIKKEVKRKRSRVASAEKGPSDSQDALLARTMSAVAALLPTSNECPLSAECERSTPHVLRALLARSSILDSAAELLRNSSLEDIAKRFRLYNSLNAMICSLSQSASTMGVVIHPRRAKKLGHNLLKVSLLSQLPQSGTRLQDESEDFSAPLLDIMKGMADQCAAIERSAAMLPKEFDDAESKEMLLLCQNFLATTKNLLESCTIDTSRFDTKDTPNDSKEWQNDVAVLALPDDEIRSLYSYIAEADDTMLCPSVPGRMRRILKELASLKANLPPDIFVRYADSRPDMMKVLIVGPKGTPYENGLFEFDLLCPTDYPQSPPKMTLRTTGRGMVRFNPNLYNTGYVCLSLLGTWAGESWDPARSTILQVLVSIQAMVLCDKPYCNEPGRQDLGDTDASKAYDRHLYPNVVRFAMLEWIDGKVSDTSASAHYTPQAYLGELDEDHLTSFPPTQSSSAYVLPTLGSSGPSNASHFAHTAYPLSYAPSLGVPMEGTNGEFGHVSLPKKSASVPDSSEWPVELLTEGSGPPTTIHSETPPTTWSYGSFSEHPPMPALANQEQAQAKSAAVGEKQDSPPNDIDAGESDSPGLKPSQIAHVQESLLNPTIPATILTTKDLHKYLKYEGTMSYGEQLPAAKAKKVQAPRKAKTASPYGGAGAESMETSTKDTSSVAKGSNLSGAYQEAGVAPGVPPHPLAFPQMYGDHFVHLAPGMSMAAFPSQGHFVPFFGAPGATAMPQSPTSSAPPGNVAKAGVPTGSVYGYIYGSTKVQNSKSPSPYTTKPGKTKIQQALDQVEAANKALDSALASGDFSAIPVQTPPPRKKSSPPLAAGTKIVSVFDDVAKLHFEHNREQIIKTVQDWVKERVDFKMTGGAASKKRGRGRPSKKKKASTESSGMDDEAGQKEAAKGEVVVMGSSAPLRAQLSRSLEKMGDSFREYY